MAVKDASAAEILGAIARARSRHHCVKPAFRPRYRTTFETFYEAGFRPASPSDPSVRRAYAARKLSILHDMERRRDETMCSAERAPGSLMAVSLTAVTAGKWGAV